jgi:predicted transcriptional regulator of viral defense system
MTALELLDSRPFARTRDLERAGLSRAALQRLVHRGVITRLRRGIYSRSGEIRVTEHHDLAAVSTRVTRGVVCLLSALRFHRMGTQNPSEVWVAIDPKARKPRVGVPPTRFVRFSGQALSTGIEHHLIEGITVAITSPAKTVADCFKYRNKIGLDVALEALREYRRSRRPLGELLQAAQTVRVARVLRPYLEALT